MLKKLTGLDFVVSEASEALIRGVVSDIEEHMNEWLPHALEFEMMDSTSLDAAEDISFDEETLVVIGVEAHKNKVPMEVIKKLQHLKGNGAMAVAVVTYSTQTCGQSLFELYTFAEDQGFRVISAASFVADKDNPILGKKIIPPRPDSKDFELVNAFTLLTTHKLKKLCGTDVQHMKCKPKPLCISSKKPGLSAIVEIASTRRRVPEWFL